MDLFIPKLLLKLQMLAFVVFVAALLGYTPDWSGILGFFLFFLTYISTYFYNDIVDLDDDRRKAVYPAKLLARGWASYSEYLFLTANLFAMGVFLATLYNPLLGVVAFLAVFLNNIRSHVRGILPRQLLLVFVEFLNFAAGWVALYGSFPNLLASAVFLEYGVLYAFGHIVYKVRKSAGSLLHRVDGIVFVTLVLLLAWPTFYVLLRHWVGVLFGIGGALLYIFPQQLRVYRGDLNDQEFINRIYWQHTILMTIVGLWFLAGALIVLP